MAGKKGCGGKKGRSGRKSLRIEQKIVLLENLAVDGGIGYLENGTEKQKFALVKELAPKALARRLKIGGDEDNPIRVIFRAAPDPSEQEAR